MKWSETITSKCRYGEIAERIWGKWDILWEHSVADYQGQVKFLARAPEDDLGFCYYPFPKFVYVEWTYGSCSGCDEWESRALCDEEVMGEMTRTAAYYDAGTLTKWLDMLRQQYKPESWSDPEDNWELERIKAIEAALAEIKDD